jgi:DNA-3-methyladenine glycosylase
MFGPAGHAYVYFTYGIHWMFNIVTGQTGQANAVLIRALEPVDGVDIMQQNRGERPYSQLTNGPARLAQALQIDKSHNGANLCDPNGVIWVADGENVPQSAISSGPRIGLGKTPEPWYSAPWRYWITGNAFVSK